jgi:hypothetical protein
LRRYITRAEFLGDGTGSVRSDMLEKAEMAFNLMDRYKLSFRTSSQYNENSKQIFPEMKLRGLCRNSYIHVSVSDLYILTIGLPIVL